MRIADSTAASLEFRGRVKSPKTLAAYATSWTRFVAWCDACGVPPLPTDSGMVATCEESVATYLAQAGESITRDGKPQYAMSTIQAWCTAIGYHYAAAGLPNPVCSETVRLTLARLGDLRAQSGAEADTAVPLSSPMLRRLVASIDESAQGWRDRIAARRDIALLVLQFAAGLRRSELVAMSVADVCPMSRSENPYLLIRVPATGGTVPGDEVAVGRGIDARTCPGCVLLRWLTVLAVFDRAVASGAADSSAAGQLAVQRALRRDDTGAELHICDSNWPQFRRVRVPLFRPLDRDGLPHERAITARSVPNMLKRRALEAGFEPEVVAKLRGHSGRVGTIVQALANGADAQMVARHLRHRDARTVSSYIEPGQAESVSVADHLGL